MEEPPPDLRELMEGLHEDLARELLRKIQLGEASPAELSVARAFLRDNNIDVSSRAGTGAEIHKLAENLPFQDPDEYIAQ